jgi:catechol 2,3-dioxygenase-like lactoylglutathione lyase family enzyme
VLTEFDHIRISVSDIGRSRVFYRDGLGLAEVCAGETGLPEAMGGGKGPAVVFQLGPSLVECFQVPSGEAAGLVQHLGILCTDLKADKAALAAKPRVEFHDSPLPTCAPGLIGTLGGRRICWFTDPDGLNLALTEVAKPEEPKGPLSGIDHIQINVTDYHSSLAFYRDEVGFAIERIVVMDKGAAAGGDATYTMLVLGRTRFEVAGMAAEGAQVRVGFTSHMGWLCDDPVEYFKWIKARVPESFADHTKDGPAFNARGHVFRRYKFNLFDPDRLVLQMVQPHPEIDPTALMEGETGGGLHDPGRMEIVKP